VNCNRYASNVLSPYHQKNSVWFQFLIGTLQTPLDSWWKLADSMAKRVVKYGVKDEVLEKAKKLCQKNLSDDWCREYREVEKYLRDAEEIIEKQQEAEREFLKLLEEFDPQKPEESFKRLWVSERTYRRHLEKRLERKEVEDWYDYLLQTFHTLSSFTGVYYERYSSSWDRVLYDKERRWMVVLTEEGRIISSMKVDETLRELFERHMRKAQKDGQELTISRGKTNERLKEEVKRRLKVLQSKRKT